MIAYNFQYLFDLIDQILTGGLKRSIEIKLWNGQKIFVGKLNQRNASNPIVVSDDLVYDDITMAQALGQLIDSGKQFFIKKDKAVLCCKTSL